MSGRVIVVGSVNVDLVVTIDRLPARGETVIGGRFARHHGGKGGNQAVAAARLGASTSFVGAVGGDAFGEEALAALSLEGVDVSEALILPAEATGVALILVDADGENSIAVAGGANAALRPEHVTAGLGRLRPGPADVVLVGHEIPTAAVRAALDRARRAGATTILNPAPAGGLGRDTLDLARFLTPNLGELAVLAAAGGEPEALARRLLGDEPGARAVLVTLGADGALLVEGDGVTSLPASPVDVVDTVGAGDTLNGALAAGLAGGVPLVEAARRAVLAAGLAVTRAGAREGMPRLAELEAATGA